MFIRITFKKLSYVVPENTIVSGGLDGKVVLWDLGTLNPIQEIQTHSLNTALPNSIYSLANNNSNLISTGGPSNTINLYDKRLPNNSNNIKKLIGHQDNIRCLLMNDNFILSGSSDTTIKLWDLRNFKVYKNFDIHDDAIWSLSTSISSSPGILNQCDDYYNTDFKVFYSGDKGGKIVKTDLSYLSTNLKKENLGFDTFTGSDDLMDEKLGVSTIIAKTNSPIISLCCETDVQPNSILSSTTLLASTELSLNRYVIPDTDQLSKYQYSRNCLDYILNHDNQVNDELTSGLGEVAGEPNDLNSDFYDIVSHLSIDTNNFDTRQSCAPFSVRPAGSSPTKAGCGRSSSRTCTHARWSSGPNSVRRSDLPTRWSSSTCSPPGRIRCQVSPVRSSPIVSHTRM